MPAHLSNGKKPGSKLKRACSQELGTWIEKEQAHINFNRAVFIGAGGQAYVWAVIVNSSFSNKTWCALKIMKEARSGLSTINEQPMVIENNLNADNELGESPPPVALEGGVFNDGPLGSSPIGSSSSLFYQPPSPAIPSDSRPLTTDEIKRFHFGVFAPFAISPPSTPLMVVSPSGTYTAAQSTSLFGHEKNIHQKLTRDDKSSIDHNILKLITTIKLGDSECLLYPLSDLLLHNLLEDNVWDQLNITTHLGLCIQIAIDLLKAVDYMHNQSVLHKDIKPENIGFHLGKWCLFDFGSAKVLSDNSASMVNSGDPEGTYAYSHPGSFSERTISNSKANDIYSLGLVLNFLFSQKFYEAFKDNLVPHNAYTLMSSRSEQYKSAQSSFSQERDALEDELKNKTFPSMDKKFDFIIKRMQSMNHKEIPSASELKPAFLDLKKVLDSELKDEFDNEYKKLIDKIKKKHSLITWVNNERPVSLVSKGGFFDPIIIHASQGNSRATPSYGF